MIAFLSYMTRREEVDQGKPANIFLRTRDSNRPSRRSHCTSKLDAHFLESVFPISLKLETLYTFRDKPQLMRNAINTKTVMRLWITTAAAVPYTDDVCQIVVDTLLQMAGDKDLRPHIPPPAWDWLKNRPLLHPGCRGLRVGTTKNVVLKVQQLEDVELIASYLFVVWSEWNHFYPSDCTAMLDMIRGRLGGAGAARYREDLIQRLNHVLSQLDRGLEFIRQHSLQYNGAYMPMMKQQYEQLRGVLMEADTRS